MGRYYLVGQNWCRQNKTEEGDFYENCAVFELSYLTETGQKRLRIKLSNTLGEFFKDLGFNKNLKLDAEPKLMKIFKGIKKEMERMEPSVSIIQFPEIIKWGSTAFETTNEYTKPGNSFSNSN